MKVTDFSLLIKDVLVKIPYVNQKGLDNLCDSGRLDRKKVLGVWKYDSCSVDSFLESFNINDYYQYSEVVDLIKEYGICDEYKYYGMSKKNKPKCVYVRKNSEFPLSVKNLINYGYMEVDESISPILITKESVLECIKLFKTFGLNNKLYTKKPIPKIKHKTTKPSNNSSYNQNILNDLMNKIS